MNRQLRNRSNATLSIAYAVSAFMIPILLMLIFYIQGGYAPFGTDSLASKDANVQYLDLFSYYKDVLNGINNVGFTFSKGLGGSCIADFSYYLSSPLNLLIVLFRKDQLPSFFDILVAIKFGFCSLTMYLYLQYRCALWIDSKLKHHLTMLLAICYGLSQYNIAQCSNIMWLDGVIMLPLIALAVYWLLEKDKPILLSVTVGASILFNWYSAGISCLFIILWFLVELAVYSCGHKLCLSSREDRRLLVRKSFSWFMHMFCGVLLSAVLFLPTVLAFRTSNRGSFSLWDIYWQLVDTTRYGNVLNAVQGYTIGAKSVLGAVALYCGGLVISGFVLFFIIKSVSRREKIIFGAVSLLILLCYYWHPLLFIFSLLKNVSSHWYRFSYLSEFLLVVGAAVGFLRMQNTEAWKMWVAAGIAAGCLLVANWVGSGDLRLTCLTVFFVLASVGVLYFALSSTPRLNTRLGAILLTILLLADLYEELSSVNITSHNSTYSSYTLQQEQLLDSLSTMDNSTYRMTQTYYRNNERGSKVAYYDESLAHNYMSITSYTSIQDRVQLDFLARAGYRNNNDVMSIVNNPVLGLDSLLGVKYVLSKYDITGLETTGIENIYQNPYCLPLAFTYKNSDTEIEYNGDPFEYQNRLYSALLGTEIELYIPLSYIQTSAEPYTYELQVPDGNFVVYGSIPWNSEYNGTLDVNGIYQQAYAGWLSPSVFYIPENDAGTWQVTVTSDGYYDIALGYEQFYAMNLDVMAEITEKLTANQADVLNWENGHVLLSVATDTPSQLFISIPSDSGWTIKVNGTEVECDLFAECFYSVPLDQGSNRIEFVYHVPGVTAGIWLSGISAVLLVIEAVLESRRKCPRTIVTQLL